MTYETKRINSIDLFLQVKELSKLISDYSEICVPEEVKHMKTTWLMWAHQLNEEKSIKHKCIVNVVPKDETKLLSNIIPKWISLQGLPNFGIIGYFDNDRQQRFHISTKITQLNEKDGSIVIDFEGYSQLIILHPHIKEISSYTFQRTTCFSAKMEIDNCLFDFSLYVEQIEDLNFKMVSSLAIYKDNINIPFPNFKQLKELKNALKKLSSIYSKQEIKNILQEAKKRLFCKKIELEHIDLIRFMSNKEFKFGSSTSKDWLEMFNSNELNTVVLNSSQYFSTLLTSETYFEIGFKNKNIRLEQFLDQLWFQFHRTKVNCNIPVPLYYNLNKKSFKGQLYFDGTGWNFHLENNDDDFY